MSQAIRIRIGDLELSAELNDSPTAKAIVAELPIQGKAQIWGDEIYFSTPVQEPEGKEAREVMEVGDLAYWPPGNAFCILFGPTPASTDDRPRLASASNHIGKILDDVKPLRTVTGGTGVTLELA